MAKNKYVDFVPDNIFEELIQSVIDAYGEENRDIRKNGVDHKKWHKNLTTVNQHDKVTV